MPIGLLRGGVMRYRTHNCGELRESNIGEKVKLAGWLYGIRDLGSMLFFVLRDFYGTTQGVVSSPEMMGLMRSIPRESTLSVTGTVVKRSAPNPDMPTGMIEIIPDSEGVEILGKCYEQLPFEVSTSTQSREDTRLKYRFLDLRNPDVKEKIVFRAKVVSWLRQKMTELGFLEIATPILTGSSPEGARDFIVPSRLHPGKFYALPQAPQQYKQLLMTSGFDKYFQIAPCFRDEDARADRSPGEFYQLDTEMCFATQDDVFAVMEEVLTGVFSAFSNKKVDKGPYRRISYRDAMRDYGTDKPDLRNPLIIKDVTDILKGAAPFFTEEKTIKAIAVDNFSETRKFIDALMEKVKQNGAENMYWFRLDASEALVGGISKFVGEKIDALKERLGIKAGSFVVIIAEKSGAEKQAGFVRTELGIGLDLLEKDAFRFCWIVDFPMYEYDEEGNLTFCHNPFSMPQGGLEALNGQDPLEILAYQYDSVVNGVELSSGAVRNHEPAIMEKAFEIAGYGREVIEQKFSALYNAFKFGAPPHAGIAPGVDRIVMLLADEPNIREVIAFPMDRNARDLLMGAPSEVTERQLKDVHIKLDLPTEDKA